MAQNRFAQEFNFSGLMKFSMPTMIMMVFLALYQMVDGVFISNLVGDLALTALNVVYPFTSVLIAAAVMLASGSGAIIALNMGMGNDRQAKENFTFIVLVGVLLSVLMSVLGFVYMDEMLRFLGATPRIYQMCYDYLIIMVLSAPMAMLQLLFQTFFVTAGKPRLGLLLTVLGGVANIVLDAVFMTTFQLGIAGAAWATAIGYSVTALFGLFYFAVCRKGQLYFVKPRFRFQVLKSTCLNGSSEMVNNFAMAITTLLFNIVGLHFLKEEGVAAISILLYAQFIMTAVFMGYSNGVAPIFSYKYGADDKAQIRRIFRLSIWFVAALSAVMFLLSFVVAKPIASVFAAGSPDVLSLAVDGFKLFSVSFLFTGLNIFACALFTAFSNGLVSGMLSFLRTFVLLVIALIALPAWIGASGIWLAVPVAEGIAVIFSLAALYRYRKTYSYGKIISPETKTAK